MQRLSRHTAERRCAETEAGLPLLPDCFTALALVAVMADDKTKRLRTHVVKELYDTEADYTDHLEFTVTVCTLTGEPGG